MTVRLDVSPVRSVYSLWSMPGAGKKRKRSPTENTHQTPQPKHPYLSGNFAPIKQTLPLTPCTYTGTIPSEFSDGEYVRNGSNPVSNEDLGRDAHWFDGDGMLSGVSFRKDASTGNLEPEFVNQFVYTDLYLNTLSSPRLRVPILPSIATLVNPLASILYVTLRILRTVLLVILSHLPGSKQKIKKISAANTNVVYHDGRALATCESGPPMRIQLPGLETVGWYNGATAEGEGGLERPRVRWKTDRTFGEGSGLIKFMREWTTAHPKIDPQTKEMLMFHSCFAPPYVQYSIIPQTSSTESVDTERRSEKLLNAAVPGVHKAKMMHDFGVSSKHTVIMDLPLILDPLNQLKGLPPVSYDSGRPSRFGVFPRWHPEQVKWFNTDAACIFHTANTWDEADELGHTITVNMLACRLTSAALIFVAGNTALPVEKRKKAKSGVRHRLPSFAKSASFDSSSTLWERQGLLESPPDGKDSDEEDSDIESLNDEECRLYYYNFHMHTGTIDHQWALSAIPFEFPSVSPHVEMQEAQYIYGCSTTTTDFGSALGKGTKVDAIAKIDARTLISRGREHPPRSVTGVVDPRTVAEILASQDPHDPIQVFCMPKGWFAQEPRFVPSHNGRREDDGHLVFYAFDEAQLDGDGEVPLDSSLARAKSELWIVDARDMTTIAARVHLPQRVPYGLHGSWFSAEQIREQRPVESLRTTTRALSKKDTGVWMSVRDWVEKKLG